MQLSAMFGAPAENILSQDMLLSPELCARLQSLRYGNTDDDSLLGPSCTHHSVSSISRRYGQASSPEFGVDYCLEPPKLQPQHRLELFQLPPPVSSADESATVSSVVQRMIEAVAFRAAGDLFPGLVEQMEAQQEILWEAELQAEDWQRQMVLQRLHTKPSVQRSGPSRSISMPTSRQHFMLPLSRDNTSAVSSASHTLTEISEDPPISAVPLIKVPSSVRNVHTNNAAKSLLLGVGSSEPVPSTSAASQQRVSPRSSVPFLGERSKLTQRRLTEGSLTAFAPLQPVASPAARAGEDGKQAAPVSRLSSGSSAPHRTAASAASKTKSAQMMLAPSLSAGSKAESSQVGGRALGAQDAARARVPAFSHPLSLLSASDNQYAGCQMSQNTALLSNKAACRTSQSCSSNSREFFPQPSPGAVLANGAPAALQKKIVELMRRQSDTIKWEQKSGRAVEHCTGLNSLQSN